MKLVVKLRLQKKPHKSVVRNTELFELIHSDLCEFENKSDAFENFQDFLKVENQFGRKIKRIRSDRDCEYESSAFNSFV